MNPANWQPFAPNEAIAKHAHSVLRPGGALVLEVAAGAADRVAGLFRELGYEDVLVTKDLSGRDRVVEGVSTSTD